ncbi:MAG: FAD-dependent oxidoreductase [Promethearchaeota archaeon]
MTDFVGATLVVGGGIAGIQSSLDLADMGFKVYLVESSPSIGGKMAQLDKTFPTNDCSMCILAPKMVECSRHPNIEIITYSEVLGYEGEPGNFRVKVLKKARYISEEKCIGCGTCAEKCPVRNKIKDEFNADLNTRRAAYRPFPQAVPATFLIDKDACIYFKTGKCRACEKYCPANAVEFDQQDEEITLDVGSIIVAAGMSVYDPSPLSNFGYAVSPDIITSMEFERILSASGPYDGHILRPSDKLPPRKMAFIQCVGSRDRKIGREFCSAACCMYAIKEAIIAKEHAPDLEIAIYFMDIRAFGKDFDKYYERAKELGIRFVRSRPGSARPNGKQIDVTYENRAGELKVDSYDLVVLSVGFDQNPDVSKMCAALGIEMNEFGFVKTDPFSPNNTSVDGIYTCGILSGPKDIPDTVAQASGAVTQAASLLSSARGTLSADVKVEVEEKDVSPSDEPRIGVIVCRCGTNIAAVVDVPGTVEYAKTLPNVVEARELMYSCSSDSQEVIKKMIVDNDLNRFLVASCSPRSHEPLFRNTCKEAGLNPYLFSMVNIRDQDSWVHMKEPEAATEKAKDLIRMKLGKLRLAEPLATKNIPLDQRVLVIGGGLAGMTAAIDASEQGFETYLVERTGELGGLLNKIHFLFEDEDPRAFKEEMEQRINADDKIKVFLNSEPVNVDGYVGNYTVTIKDSEGGMTDLEAGTIVVATGGEVYKPTEYLYGKDDRVLTTLELEEQLANGDVGDANTFVFIQCVGSRNEEHPYCNSVCCTEAVKNAIRLKELKPDASVFVLYRDVRLYGFNEKYYGKARDLGVVFVQYEPEKPPMAVVKDGKLAVTFFDNIVDRNLEIYPDRLVLSVGVVQEHNHELSQMLKVPLTSDGFFLEAHMKLRPVDFATDGVFLAGNAQWPKLIPEVIAQANGAAARAGRLLSMGELETEGIIANVDPDKCIGCGMCAENCPYRAIRLEVVGDETKARVIEVSCKGCGLCGASCPEKAITMGNFTDDQLVSEFELLMKEG